MSNYSWKTKIWDLDHPFRLRDETRCQFFGAWWAALLKWTLAGWLTAELHLSFKSFSSSFSISLLKFTFALSVDDQSDLREKNIVWKHSDVCVYWHYYAARQVAVFLPWTPNPTHRYRPPNTLSTHTYTNKRTTHTQTHTHTYTHTYKHTQKHAHSYGSKSLCVQPWTQHRSSWTKQFDEIISIE